MEVKLDFIKRQTWSGFTKYPGTKDSLCYYMTRKRQWYTGLTKADETRLEEALGYEHGTLDKNSSFWKTFSVLIGSTGGPVLNTENPNDELTYLFLKNHIRVAPDMQHISPRNDYVLVNLESEAIEANKKFDIKRKALIELGKMSHTDYRKALRLLGRSSDSSSQEVVEQTVNEFVESQPQAFLDMWVNNKNRDMQFMIEDAISNNVIRRQRNIYYYGTDIIGNSMDDTIAYLMDKKNNDILATIKAEVEAKNIR
jgi:hypothetical protein